MGETECYHNELHIRNIPPIHTSPLPHTSLSILCVSWLCRSLLLTMSFACLLLQLIFFSLFFLATAGMAQVKNCFLNPFIATLSMLCVTINHGCILRLTTICGCSCSTEMTKFKNITKLRSWDFAVLNQSDGWWWRCCCVVSSCFTHDTVQNAPLHSNKSLLSKEKLHFPFRFRDPANQNTCVLTTTPFLHAGMIAFWDIGRFQRPSRNAGYSTSSPWPASTLPPARSSPTRWCSPALR